MKFQSKGDALHSVDENLALEAEAHDEDYEGKMPFGLPVMTFTIDDVWRINDHAFKRGTYRRGLRKRRLFQLMQLDHIKGMRLLDVGTGQGHNAVFFAMYGAEVHGFDLSEKGIAMAKSIAEANSVAALCHFQVANVSELPYEDEFFDIVVCNAVLHHVVKYPAVADQLRRVLKPGGKLYFAEGLRENVVYKFVRSLRRALRPVHFHGDIDLERGDLLELTKDYCSVDIEQFGLFEKFAQGLGGDYANNILIRSIYFVTYALDRFLLAVFPALRKQCLEVVGVAVK